MIGVANIAHFYPLKSQPAYKMPQMTVDALLLKIQDGQRKMSRKNPHRLLLMQCEDALIQLAVRVGELSAAQEAQHAPDPPRIILP